MSADKYERQEMIGSGSFGRAWLVRRTTTGKPYVLKEIRVAGLSERDRCQVLTEVAALAKCRHVNVVRYRETFLSDTQTLNPVLCIVMEYAQAGKVLSGLQKKSY